MSTGEEWRWDGSTKGFFTVGLCGPLPDDDKLTGWTHTAPFPPVEATEATVSFVSK